MNGLLSNAAVFGPIALALLAAHWLNLWARKDEER